MILSPTSTKLCPMLRAFHRVARGSPGEARGPTFTTMSGDDELFRFTRGRFVQNEDFETASRYTRFNVHELAKVAASAVGAKSCVGIEKLVDGMHNKTLLLAMDDGQQVIGKIPNPNAGQPHFTTASEVATMRVMLHDLNIPVPRVHTWCSHADKTPVGAEYIIMDKAAGVPLESVWPALDLTKRFAVAKAIAQFQSAWTRASYEGYGSVYYSSDLPDQYRLPLRFSMSGDQGESEFALGPITGRDWVDDGRQTISFDRGPWTTLEGYLEAVGLREMACVQKLPRLPYPQVTLCGPGTYQPTRAKKLRALEFYLQAFKHLAPSDPVARKPSAWHGDLHLENIFVDSSDPTTVTCLIDWQSTEVAPLFVQARQPYILEHPGPRATGLDRLHLPDDFATLSPDEKEEASRLLLDQSLCVGYMRWIKSKNPEIWRAFEFQDTPVFELLLLARSLLVDGEAMYSARILEHIRSGDDVLKSSGLHVPESVRIEIDSDAEGAIRGVRAMTEVEESLGSLFPERGCVRPEQYLECKAGLLRCKEQIIAKFATSDSERAAWERSWPFDE